MRKKISFVILSNSGAPAKQISASRTAIRLFCVAILVCLCGAGYVLWDYVKLRQAATRLRLSENTISSQLDEIETQRKQIQGFSGKIDALKEQGVYEEPADS